MGEEELPDLKEFDDGRASPDIYNIPYLIEGDWSLGFLWVTGLSFAVWLGVTAQAFEDTLGFCSLIVTVGLILFALGRISSDPILKKNSKRLFHLSGGFVIVVAIAHFLRVKTWFHGFL
jgi:hypothetical protein